jgi:hypothetical protein
MTADNSDHCWQIHLQAELVLHATSTCSALLVQCHLKQHHYNFIVYCHYAVYVPQSLLYEDQITHAIY